MAGTSPHGHKANFPENSMRFIITAWIAHRSKSITTPLRSKPNEVKPKMITAGASAYSRTIDFARMREIADSVGACLSWTWLI